MPLLVTPPGAGAAASPLVNASGESWIGLNQSTLPVANLNGVGLAFDSADNETVLFGACPTLSASPCNETWAFHSGNWSRLTPGRSPPPLGDVAMAYDSQSRSVVLFGGGGPSGLNNGTWEFSAGNWNRLNTTVSPPSGARSMVYDAAAGDLLLFADGGPNATNGTWTFNNGNWTDDSVSVEPPRVASMTYDPVLRATVAFALGNSTGGNYTWLFRNGSWSNVSAAHAPDAQSGVTLTYDALSESVIMFGGIGTGGQDLGETWAYNGSAWARLHPSTAPSPRVESAMAFDPGDGLTLLVGGGGADTWAWGAGNVHFVSVPGSGGSSRMGAATHPNGSSAWYPFGSYAVRAIPNPGFSGQGVSVLGSLLPFNGSYLLFGNATVRANFLAFPTLSLESLPSFCEIDFNGTGYANGSSPPFVTGRTFALGAPACGSVVFGTWSGSTNASVANLTNSTTTVTLSGPATIVAHFSANLRFFIQPAGAGGILLNGSRASSAGASLYPAGTYSFRTVAAPGWRFSHLATSGGGISISNGELTVLSSGWVLANFSAYPTVVVGTTYPACGEVSLNGTSESNGTLVGTSPGAFPVAAPTCADALFLRWETTGNVSVAAPTRANTTVTVAGNGTLRAVLGRAAWLTISVEPTASAGSVTWNSGLLENGTRTQELVGRYPIAEVPAGGWQFVGWETAGGITEATSVATLSANGTLTALFEIITITTPMKGGGGWALTMAEGAAVGAGVIALVVAGVMLLRRRGGSTAARGPNGEPDRFEELGNSAGGGGVDPPE